MAAELGSLPSCFALSAEPWSDPPDAGYEFEPTRLILGSDSLYSDFYGEVVGQVAVIIDAERGPIPIGWRFGADGAIETISPVPALGGTILRIAVRDGRTLSGEIEWSSDYGTGERASAEVSASSCSRSDSLAVQGHRIGVGAAP